MKVLEVNTEKGWRGGERQTCYNISGFINAGVTTELLCRVDQPLEQQARKLSMKVHSVAGPIGAMFFLAFNGRKYDIIHAQTAKAQFAAVITRPLHRKPIVYSRRLDFVPEGFLTRLKYNLTTKTIAISAPVKLILDRFGVKNVEVISDAVAAPAPKQERVRAFKEEHGLNGKKIVGTTAAFVQHKDPLTMVKAVKELLALRQDVVFVHFGEGALKEEAKRLAVQLGVAEHYHFLGFTHDIEELFPLFDVFAMSSEEEGLGSSVLDAFVNKVPVVSTDAGGLKPIVEGRGILCRVKDHLALARGMNELLNNTALRDKFTADAHAYAMSAHSISKIAEEYLKVFRTLSRA